MLGAVDVAYTLVFGCVCIIPEFADVHILMTFEAKKRLV